MWSGEKTLGFVDIWPVPPDVRQVTSVRALLAEMNKGDQLQLSVS